MRVPLAVILAAVTAVGSPDAHAQPPVSVSQVRYDAAAEVSSAVYYMATVVDALKVEYGAEIRAKDSRIRQLEQQLGTAQTGSAEAKRLSDELARLQQEVFVSVMRYPSSDLLGAL